jgi:hypothetical protein
LTGLAGVSGGVMWSVSDLQMDLVCHHMHTTLNTITNPMMHKNVISVSGVEFEML